MKKENEILQVIISISRTNPIAKKDIRELINWKLKECDYFLKFWMGIKDDKKHK